MERTGELLASYVDALRPVIYIRHFDSVVVDSLLRSVHPGTQILEYNNALGAIDFETKSPMLRCSLEQFLLQNMDEGFTADTFLLLRDVHHQLEDGKIIALIKRIAENTLYKEGYQCVVFIAAPKLVIPLELENYITVFDIPYPDDARILEIIDGFAQDQGIRQLLPDSVRSAIALSFKGLSEFQIRQILNLAYQDGGYIDAGDKKLILQEKEQLIKKSGMLELVSFTETIEDIGGLSNLKQWLRRKARVFHQLDQAIAYGVDIPKGIMIVGMPGCGKSLTAKATAGLFELPLVRLDIGRLLGKYVGESEENMRKALQLAEAISPCVLWIDEIEKAFSGVGSTGGGNDVTTRLFGQFLTWLQEKSSTVFVVATANDISCIPPEFLRKGRFDELFFVDLPNRDERRRILEIHLKKRGKWNPEIDTAQLIARTEGYNGADLEAIVKETIESAFLKKQPAVRTGDLLATLQETKSISTTLKDKITRIRETVKKMDIKNASATGSERSV